MIIGHPMVRDLNLRRSAEIWKKQIAAASLWPRVAGHGSGYDMDFPGIFSIGVICR